MQIQLLNTMVDKFEFSRAQVEDEDFQLEFAPAFNEEEVDSFIVRFKVEFKSTQNYQFVLNYVAEFKTNEIVKDEFKKSQFPAVNAPAIAFPFLRSFISMFTLNAGFDAVILPSINFQAAYDKQKRVTQE
ncbi:MAG: preprotein translocase subunit SecB [Psychromonas sp.]|jgi:preprotein translocase subunit SecB|uniref:protein-export chaperone SecB n=1 Tax=Psychromonas sp. TaxID=1884585 RepID=UPI0039E3F9AB